MDKLRSIVDALGYYSNGSNFSYRVYLKVEERENWRGGGGGGLYKEDGKARRLFYSCKYSDFWSYLGCSGYDANTLSRQDVVWGCT